MAFKIMRTLVKLCNWVLVGLAILAGLYGLARRDTGSVFVRKNRIYDDKKLEKFDSRLDSTFLACTR